MHEYNTWANQKRGALSASGPIAEIANLESEVAEVFNCLNTGNIANHIQKAQSDIGRLQAEILEQEEHTNISKQRLQNTSASDRPISYYESWFPVYRPAKPITLIILITGIIFMVILSILLFLSVMGISLNASLMATSSSGGHLVGLLNFVRAQGWPFWLMTAAFLGVLTYFLVRETKPPAPAQATPQT